MSSSQPLYNLTKDQLDEVYKKGSFMIVEDMPKGTEFGIDYGSWSTGPKFMGLKMIPPGLHFIFFSAVSKEGTVAPRAGFFHFFKEKEVLVKKYDIQQEILVESDTQFKTQEIDTMLAPYPYQHYQRWCSLTTHVTPTAVTRVQPQCTIIHAATQLLSNPRAEEDIARANSVEEKLDANFVQDDSQVMRFSKVDRRKIATGLSARDLSHFYMDSTISLNHLISQCSSTNELLAELQISFIVFLLGHVYSAFEQWKLLVDTVCRAEQAIISQPSFYKTFIRTLHFHLKETPRDFFVDIVSRDNFLVRTLKVFFDIVLEGGEKEEGDKGEIDKELSGRAEKFRCHLEKYYSWDFSCGNEDDPVIVEVV